MFDIIESEYFEYVLKFDPAAQEAQKHNIIGQMQDLGYESHNSLFNLGTMAMFSILYLTRVVVLALLWIASNLCSKLDKTV